MYDDNQQETNINTQADPESQEIVDAQKAQKRQVNNLNYEELSPK